VIPEGTLGRLFDYQKLSISVREGDEIRFELETVEQGPATQKIAQDDKRPDGVTSCVAATAAHSPDLERTCGRDWASPISARDREVVLRRANHCGGQASGVMVAISVRAGIALSCRNGSDEDGGGAWFPLPWRTPGSSRKRNGGRVNGVLNMSKDGHFQPEIRADAAGDLQEIQKTLNSINRYRDRDYTTKDIEIRAELEYSTGAWQADSAGVGIWGVSQVGRNGPGAEHEPEPGLGNLGVSRSSYMYSHS